MLARLSLPALPPAINFINALRVLAALLGALVLVIVASNAYILLTTRGEASNAISDLPHAQAAIVPGAQVRPDGTMSLMLADRVDRTVKLWRAGKVDRILVSGDHGQWQYDEPDTMREALIKAGVPGRVIFTDHAGFNTRATMVRAKKIFDVSSAIVVTQGFHMARALWLGKRAGLEVHGLAADRSGYGLEGRKSKLREVLARVKAVEDVVTGAKPRFLGPKVPVTGSAAASRG